MNRAGLVIHSAIHEARPDVQCVLHAHTRAGVAVSAQRQGLLPLSQQATLVLGSLSYHDYEGIAVRDDERARLQKDLGQNTHFILRNHGLLVAASSIPQAFYSMYMLETACQIQTSAQAGSAELIRVGQDIVDEVTQSVAAMGSSHPADVQWPALLRRVGRLSPGYDR